MKKLKIDNAATGGLFRKLQYFIHAGILTSDALFLMAEDAEDENEKNMFREMALNTESGMPLSEVFRKAGGFEDYACDMLEAGEETGKLEETLGALADNYGSRADMDSRLTAALFYPALMLLIMIAVIAALLVYVLPIFNDVYARLGSSLTGIAGALLRIGEGLGKVTPLLCTVIGLAAIYLALFAAFSGIRSQLVADWEKSRGNKGAFGKINMARFAQVVYLGMSSGLSTERILELASKMLPKSEEKCEECLTLIKGEKSLGAAMGETGLLPKAESGLLDAGIKSGSGEAAMAQISSRLTVEANSALETATAKIEPAMVVISSVLVGLILVAVMLPLINIMSAIG